MDIYSKDRLLKEVLFKSFIGMLKENDKSLSDKFITSSYLKELGFVDLVIKITTEELSQSNNGKLSLNILNNFLNNKVIKSYYDINIVDIGKITNYAVDNNNLDLFEMIYTNKNLSKITKAYINNEEVSKQIIKKIFNKVENEGEFEIFTFLISNLNYKLTEADERFIYINKYSKVISIIDNNNLFVELNKNIVSKEVKKDKFKL